MTRKKRERRDAKRPPRAPEVHAVEIGLPEVGPSTWRAGWKMTWDVGKHQVRHGLWVMKMMVAVFFIFGLAKMGGMYLLNIVVWGKEGVSPEMSQYFNAALWHILGLLFMPLALFPWFAARMHWGAGLPAAMGLVSEIWEENRRTLHAIGLGVLHVVIMGFVGAYTPDIHARWGVPAAVAWIAVAWLLMQVWLLPAAARIWIDRVPLHRALWAAALALRQGWRPLVGVASALLVQLLVVAIAVGFLIVAPLAAWSPPMEVAMNPQGLALGLFLLLLPLLVWLFAWGWHVRAAIALALLSWERPVSPVVLDPPAHVKV